VANERRNYARNCKAGTDANPAFQTSKPARKLMFGAEGRHKGDIEAATKQIELALFVENRLQMKTERK
jgi:hypothetical protein